MKFSKLPKEKRTHLVLVAIGTIAVLAGLGFGVIRAQFGSLTKLAQSKDQAADMLFKMKKSIDGQKDVEAELAEAQTVLSSLEGNMAPSASEAYSWIINTIRTYRLDYPKVDLPLWGQASAPEDVNLLPKFPYKQVVLPISSRAHYHDLGVFLSNFENKFPHIRLLNLDLKLNPDAAGQSEREKIAFTMDVVVLVRPTP